MSAVTIAVMVRNEERFLPATLKSLLQQTFQDIELRVYDNASTDSTPEIADAVAAADRRVRVVRRTENIGSIASFNTGIREARSPFLLLASGHDLFSSDYVERLVAALEANSDAVLAFGRRVSLDEDGNPIGAGRGLYSTDGMKSSVARFNVYMWANQDPIYGVIRTDSLRRTSLLPQSFAPGQLLLQQLAILGEFSHDHEAVHYVRQNRPPEATAERLKRYRRTLFRDTKRTDLLPHWRASFLLIRLAATTEIPRGRTRQQRVQLVLSSLLIFIRLWTYLRNDLLSFGRAVLPRKLEGER